MAKSKKRIYEPLEKVIVTKDQVAKIAYVAADRNGSTGIYGNGGWQVRVASALQDAQEHRYKLTNYDYVMPYSDEMWDAFQRLDAMRNELSGFFHDLRNGKIPKKLQPVVQGNLFNIENTRPIGRE